MQDRVFSPIMHPQREALLSSQMRAVSPAYRETRGSFDAAVSPGSLAARYRERLNPLPEDQASLGPPGGGIAPLATSTGAVASPQHPTAVTDIQSPSVASSGSAGHVKRSGSSRESPDEGIQEDGECSTDV